MTEHMVIHRYEVPVDGKEHEIKLPIYAKVLHTECARPDVVEFWTEVIEPDEGRQYDKPRKFRVFGTGEKVPITGWQYAGTCASPPGMMARLVWHLYQKEQR